MFSWPGVGRSQSAPSSPAIFLPRRAIMILAVAFLSINLLVDVLYVLSRFQVQRR